MVRPSLHPAGAGLLHSFAIMKFSIRLTRCALGALAAVAVMSQAWAGPRLDHVLDTKTPVSYTHLTLPTILLV